ncbi:ZP domain-containing protein-like [Haliotis rufescens]|uniref:ZP domain-containing protein-like n=1 Tax=Haliotis rufescens TaxID=6454 RepID=UPI00201F01FC|nr:ZP domain-containing protein-like [Haliotis rufescens]
MDIHIPRTLLPTHNVTLRDPTCVVPSNGTHLVISISFNQCGTTVSFSNDTVVFSNELVATVIQASHPSSIVDYGLSKDDQRVSLECVYKRHSSVELDYMPMMRAAHFYEKRYGNLDFAVKHYTDEQFTTEIANTDIPTGVNLNTEIFIDLVVDQHQTKDIGIYVPSCFATPTPSPTDPLFYPLIRSSCPAQADVRRFTAPDINEFRFSFLAFKFTRAPMQKPHASMPAVPMVYIHCQVSACPRGNCTSSCNSANGGRMKRAALGESSHLISSGPFYLKTDESTTGYSSIVVAVTMSVAVAATVVAMAAIVAWRRSASKLSAYKSLRLNMDS